MTPYQFAKAECPNMLPDGTCLLLEAAMPQGCCLRLPEWLDAVLWAALVAEARKDGRQVVTVYHGRDGRVISRKEERRDIHDRRLDLYYCLQCGTRMGVPGEVYLVCQGRKPLAGIPVTTKCVLSRTLGTSIVKEPQSFRSHAELREFLRVRGELVAYRFPRRRCRYFERAILPSADQPPPPSDPNLQARRRKAMERYWRSVGLSPGKARPRDCRRCECGEPLVKRQRLCPKCRARHRRRSYQRRRAKERRDAPQLKDFPPS